MKLQALFSLKDTSLKKNKLSTAAILFGNDRSLQMMQIQIRLLLRSNLIRVNTVFHSVL